MKILLSILTASIFCNLILYHFYDSTSSELHIARQEIVEVKQLNNSLQKQVEDAYLLREIEGKTSAEWQGEQLSLDEKKDDLLARLPSQVCTQRNEVNVKNNYVSRDGNLDVELVRVLSEASSDLQR